MAPAEPAADIVFLSDLVAAHARTDPDRPASVHRDRQLSYRELNGSINRAALALRRDGAVAGDRLAICAATSPEYLIVFLAALRLGMAAVPLPAAASPDQLVAMIRDCAPTHLFAGTPLPPELAAAVSALHLVALSPNAPGTGWEAWLAPEKAADHAVFGPVSADAEFNIIYSSGTTGTPKGIVHDHRFRAAVYSRPELFNIDGDAITLISTPLYSNTTLTAVFPTLAAGGMLLLMEKFDAERFLVLAEQHRATHAMLVPLQYRRLLAHPGFDGYDLSSFRMKYVTSSPMSADEKGEALDRWPGGLTEYYGLTEGGGSTVLFAHLNRDKLHTVGRPVPGHDIRLIDESGAQVSTGEVGEVVGRARGTLSHYLGRPDATEASRWTGPDGTTFFRSGDLARFDADGFLVICGRKKEMIISGGFNIYPSDLEAVLLANDMVSDVAVVGIASQKWGETPVAFIVPTSPGINPDALKSWANARLGKMQRLHAVFVVDEFPRNALGKVLKAYLAKDYILASAT